METKWGGSAGKLLGPHRGGALDRPLVFANPELGLSHSRQYKASGQQTGIQIRIQPRQAPDCPNPGTHSRQPIYQPKRKAIRAVASFNAKVASWFGPSFLTLSPSCCPAPSQISCGLTATLCLPLERAIPRPLQFLVPAGPLRVQPSLPGSPSNSYMPGTFLQELPRCHNHLPQA